MILFLMEKLEINDRNNIVLMHFKPCAWLCVFFSSPV